LLFIHLLLINFTTTWIVLIGGLSLILIFSILNIGKKDSLRLISISFLFLIFILLYLVFEISPVRVQTEHLLTYKTELHIIKKALPQTPFLGTGPGTFVFSYSKFKPTQINETPLWNIKFTKGAAEILDKLITIGIIGFLPLAFIFLLIFHAGFQYFKEEQKGWILPLGIFASLSTLILSQLFYPMNFTLWFSFWLLLAIFSVFCTKFKIVKRKLHTLKIITPVVLTFIYFLGFFFFHLNFTLGKSIIAMD
jgi:hypothetical protein